MHRDYSMRARYSTLPSFKLLRLRSIEIYASIRAGPLIALFMLMSFHPVRL